MIKELISYLTTTQYRIKITEYASGRVSYRPQGMKRIIPIWVGWDDGYTYCGIDFPDEAGAKEFIEKVKKDKMSRRAVKKAYKNV